MGDIILMSEMALSKWYTYWPFASSVVRFEKKSRMYFVHFISKCGAFDIDMLFNVVHLILICSSIDFLQNSSLSQFLPLPKAVASHADILRGSSRVLRAGTRDEAPKNVCEVGYKSS